MSRDVDMDILDAPAAREAEGAARHRPRRLRRTGGLRSMLGETTLSARQLIHPDAYIQAVLGVP